MKFYRTLIVIISIFVSVHLYAQVACNDYSIGKSAMLIDSIENELPNLDKLKTVDAVFNLAILYQPIDVLQSKKYAIKYLKISDSNSAINNRKIIYGVLSNLYNQHNNVDSSYYYLNLQAQLINSAYKESNEQLRYNYLSNKGEDDKTIIGLSHLYLTLLTIVILFLVIILVLHFKQQKIYAKNISAKNKELEEANTKLQNFNANVEKEVSENTKKLSEELENQTNNIIELRKTLKKVEESNYLKNTFLGSMSHQIRTPLSGILGFSDMLETELAVIGNEQLYDYAKNIHESGSKLMNIITNIFDISNIEANILELNIIKCDANQLVSDVAKKHTYVAKEKGIIYKIKLDNNLPKINADVSSLNKVLNIINNNALSYTKKGFVTISTINNNDNTVSIVISDKGKGIDKQTLDGLRDSFDYKKHGSSLTYKNNGLGLILANRLVDLMHGKLEIVSQVGVGTDVSIILPCEGSAIKNKVNSPISIINAPELGRVKIFIVEDDRMNRLVLNKMLEKSGEIVTAVDGDDAINIIAKSIKKGKVFDIMLFDVNLPLPWDGMKLMSEIKNKYPEYKNVPFIAQTAYAMADDKHTYIDAGFNDYIAKPIVKTQLLTMIQKQLELFANKT